jgi:heterodisulfide reductase subunit B
VSYLYYPGCSLKGTGRAYEESFLAVCSALDLKIEELEDWNCCGATAYMSISELKAFALSARVIAIAERQAQSSEAADIIVPCAACYLGLNKALHTMAENHELREKISRALEAEDLHYTGNIRVRHPIDVFINDVGAEKITSCSVNPLEGMRVACYYGCQILRPYADFDDQHEPNTLERLMSALGAETLDWPLKNRCCGGSLTGTFPEVGLRLSYVLLREAQRRGSDVIVTGCPLCQFNLECYQSKMSSQYEERVNVPIAYFTQLMGIAFGLPPRQLGVQRLFVPLEIGRRPIAPLGGNHVGG